MAQRTTKPALEILEERCLLSYAMTDLGTLGGATSYGGTLNASGQVAGYALTSNGSTHAFVWDSSHGMQDLGTLGGPNSVAQAINDAGQVVGYAQIAGGAPHAFVWDSSHGMQDLGTLGGTGSQAAAINNSGQVAGSSQIASGASHAFVWDSSHGMQDLGTLGGNFITVIAINNSGQVIGQSQTASGAFHAFEWDSSHGMQDLGTLGGTTSTANAINSAGQVVGNASTASSIVLHAFEWDSSHGMQDLGDLGGGGGSSTANAINTFGQVVGYSRPIINGSLHAFEWDSSHGMQDLLAVGGPNSYAQAINDAGQVSGLAAEGTFPDHSHAFLWSPRANSPVSTALTSPTIVYGTATTTLGGHLAAGSLTPAAGETVSVTFHGVTQSAILDGAGNFTTTFSTFTLGVGPALAVDYFYAGDSSLGAARGSSTLSVQPAPLTITADNQTKFYGAAMPTLTASYSGLVNSDRPGSVPVSLSTNATAASPIGSYTISASGASNPNYAISYVDGTLSVITNATTTTLTSSLSSLSVGQLVTFSATVSAVAVGAGTPTGFVDFVDSASGTDLGTVPLSGGSASLTVSSLLEDSTLPSGVPHSIVGSYNGDTNFMPSDNSATALTIVVTDVPATVIITGTNLLPADASNNPTAPVGTLLSFGGLFIDSPIEGRALNSSDGISWGLTLNGQPYSLPASTVTNGPSFSFTPTSEGNYVLNLTVVDPDGGSATTQDTLTVTSMDVNPLQNLLNVLANSANPNIDFGSPPVNPVAVTVQANPTQINAATNALNGVAQPIVFDEDLPNAYLVPVTVTLNLTSGNYTDLNLNLQPGTTVIVNGVSGSTTVVGHSPALTITSGNVTVNNVTFTTATNSPTILVAGGSLTLRNDVVQESTGFADAAISVTGGAVDLGSTSSPGNNTINVNGSGQLVQASGSGLVSTAGDTFQTNGTTINPLTSTTLTSSANPASFNQSVTLTATVAAVSTKTGTPTGSVSFFDLSTGISLGSVRLSSDVAKWTSSSLTPGSHNILAVYSGDANFISSSSSLLQNVNRFSGFLAPLSNNLAFNMNRVIPIKWQLGDSNGKVITGLSPVVSLQVAPVLSGGALGTPFNPTPSNGIGLRNDGKTYTFNWDTKGVAVGTYQIQLILADGSVQTKTLQIVTKGGYAALLVDGSGGTSTTGGLLGGDVELYVDNSSGNLTADELARIQDAVTAVDAVTEQYGVKVEEVSDSSLADVTLNMDTTSAVGSYADGVLGCTTDAGQITIINGWNFYAGSNATQIGTGQYDFETVVTHELGHALGLGHSINSSSVMYATLNTGTANRNLTSVDLNVADSDTTRACGLHAAVPVVGAPLSNGPDIGLPVFGTDGRSLIDVLDETFRTMPSTWPSDRGHEHLAAELVTSPIGADLWKQSNTDWFWANHKGAGMLDKIADLSTAEFSKDWELIQS